jgi:hypothetical protein
MSDYPVPGVGHPVTTAPRRLPPGVVPPGTSTGPYRPATTPYPVPGVGYPVTTQTRPPPVDIPPNRPVPAPDPWGVIFGPGVPGAAPGMPGAVTPAGNVPYNELVEWVLANYPGLAGFMNLDKDVKNIILQGAREGWTEAQVQAHLESTPWWRRTSESQRQWDLLESTDPAEAKRRVKSTAANLKNSSSTLGMSLSAGELANLAREAARNGWTTAEGMDALLKTVNWNKLGAGDLRANRDTIMDEQGRWLVNVSESTARDYATRIASGELTMEGAITAMRRAAKARFSWMGDLIEQGVTPEDYFRPIRDMVASTLEMAPEAINLMDQKWLGMVETRENGKMRAATTDEAMMRARRRPEWAKTRQAQDMAAGLANNLAQMFGRAG